jgi:hypothetical protein
MVEQLPTALEELKPFASFERVLRQQQDGYSQNPEMAWHPLYYVGLRTGTFRRALLSSPRRMPIRNVETQPLSRQPAGLGQGLPAWRNSRLVSPHGALWPVQCMTPRKALQGPIASRYW